MGGSPFLGEVFRSRRRELGWSLEGVAARVRDLGTSLSASQLQRIEGGQVPRADHLAALCRVYGLPEGNVLDLLLAEGERRVRLGTVRERSVEELVAEGDRLLATGRYDRARVRYVRAKARVLEDGDAGAASRIDVRLAWLDQRAGFHEAAFHRAARLAESDDVPGEVRAPALAVAFRALVRRGWLELAGGLVPALERLAGNRRVPAVTRAAARAGLASWWQARGDLERALAAQREAVELLGRAGARRERMRATLDLADLLEAAGDRRGAIARLRAVERATRGAELRGLRPEALKRLGIALVRAERFEDGLRILEEAEEVARDFGRAETRYVVRAWMHEALGALGREKEARVLAGWLARRAARHADLAEARAFLRDGSGGGGKSSGRAWVDGEREPGAQPARRPGGEA